MMWQRFAIILPGCLIAYIYLAINYEKLNPKDDS